MDKKFRLTIVIDGKSANELFAVGPKDLAYFLKEKFNVLKKDIKIIAFEEDVDSDEYMEVLTGKRPRLIHKDNYFRGDEE